MPGLAPYRTLLSLCVYVGANSFLGELAALKFRSGLCAPGTWARCVHLGARLQARLRQLARGCWRASNKTRGQTPCPSRLGARHFDWRRQKAEVDALADVRAPGRITANGPRAQRPTDAIACGEIDSKILRDQPKI